MCEINKPFVIASLVLRKIWSLKGEIRYILAKVYGHNVSDIDIRSLIDGIWLTDQVYLKSGS